MGDYQIQKGDTLSKIAKIYGTTVKELQKMNNIKNPNLIFAGKTIKLPDIASDNSFNIQGWTVEQAQDLLAEVRPKYAANLPVTNEPQAKYAVNLPVGGTQAKYAVNLPIDGKPQGKYAVNLPVDGGTQAKYAVNMPLPKDFNNPIT